MKNLMLMIAYITFASGHYTINSTSVCSDHMCKKDNILPSSASYKNKGCYCDDLCEIYGDCCQNYNFTKPDNVAKYGQVECVPTGNHFIMMVTSCSRDFIDNTDIKQNCLINPGHPIWFVPVNGNDSKIVYKNMFCALCNGEKNYTFWNIIYRCENYVDVNNSLIITEKYIKEANCQLRKSNPSQHREHLCEKNLVTSCLNQFAANSTLAKCERGPYAVIKSNLLISYKNIHCFSCSRVQNEKIVCHTKSKGPNIFPKVSERTRGSYFILLDFNRDRMNINNNEVTLDSCSYGYVYNHLEGKCSLVIHSTENGTLQLNCSMIKLKQFEFTILENNTLFHNKTKTLHEEKFYTLNSSEAFICSHRYQLVPAPGKNSSTDLQYEFLLTITGTSISLTALFFFFLIFWKFQTIWNLYTWVNVSYAFSLFIAQITFLLAEFIGHDSFYCRSLAIITHYFFLVSFFWMNIISCCGYLLVCKSTAYTMMNHERRKSFLLFSLYAWLTPSLFILAAGMIDIFHPTSDFAPQYGKIYCWMNTKYSILLFFVLPLHIIIILNMTAYYFTIKTIKKVRKMTRQKEDHHQIQTLIISVKLCVLTGITWVIGFLAAITNTSVLRIFFIILNSTFGLWVTICFLHTRVIIGGFKQSFKSFRESFR
ncbi:uncharacterized protein LOC106868747 [Octopus bimaculoides]|uniref:G-protein coupled receptors family 2 profile 2 domain-containing protein n=1 Tax=Octopus bimaculoides TaxID=37653 RepID=A0A0L8HT24_OCTBM|nr:uncharacterized protein LOC106868747 [Octopus bimaculoides]|eukprot:XP_014769632.1 PREDICTED: uncharacterized protein LOC106868747 [Octopus bimaculoides]